MFARATAFVPVMKQPEHVNALWRQPLKLIPDEGLCLRADHEIDLYAPTTILVRKDARSSAAKKIMALANAKSQHKYFTYVTCLRIELNWNTETRDRFRSDFRGAGLPLSAVNGQWRWDLRETVEREIRALAACFDISLPGAWPQTPIFVAAPGVQFEMQALYGWIKDCYYSPGEPDPDLVILDPALVWNRINSASGFRLGIARSRFEKALACFCFLYSHDSNRERLVKLLWACAGLEGFYSDNIGGASNQIRTRSPLVLSYLRNDTEGLRRKIAHIYKMRSTTLHGQRGLFSPIGEDYTDKEKILREEWDAEKAAVTLLVETVRMSIQNGLDDPSFAETIIEA